jgi:F0F1-type ATP synthase assembly protein I
MPGDDDSNANWGKFLGLGLEMAVGVGLGYVIGNWLDRKFGWAPKGVLVGTMLGLAGGMYLLIKVALRLNADPPPKAKRNEDSSSAEPPRHDREENR